MQYAICFTILVFYMTISARGTARTTHLRHAYLSGCPKPSYRHLAGCQALRRQVMSLPRTSTTISCPSIPAFVTGGGIFFNELSPRQAPAWPRHAPATWLVTTSEPAHHGSTEFATPLKSAACPAPPSVHPAWPWHCQFGGGGGGSPVGFTSMATIVSASSRRFRLMFFLHHASSGISRHSSACPLSTTFIGFSTPRHYFGSPARLVHANIKNAMVRPPRLISPTVLVHAWPVCARPMPAGTGGFTS